MIEIIDDKKRDILRDNMGNPYYRYYFSTRENGFVTVHHKDFTGQKHFQYARAWIYNEKKRIDKLNQKKGEMRTAREVNSKIEKVLEEDKISYTFSVFDSIYSSSPSKRTYTGTIAQVGKQISDGMSIAKLAWEQAKTTMKSKDYIDDFAKVKDQWIKVIQEFNSKY